MAPIVISNQPHLEIKDWLTRLDLQEYGDKFDKFGGVEELISYSESDIKLLGVKNSAHRARMVSSLVALNGNLFDVYKSSYRNFPSWK